MKEFKDARNIRPVTFRGDRLPTSSVHHLDGMGDAMEVLYPNGISRRRFLSLLSASAALATGVSCSKIDRGTVVPYTKLPGEIIPGVATYYASTFQEGCSAIGVLVKTREGRPIHIEGNPDHPVSRGTLSLRAMGDLLGLYDPDRLRGPLSGDQSAAWEAAEQAMAEALGKAGSGGKKVLLLTGAILSPSQRALIGDLQRAVSGLQHVCWEPAVNASTFYESGVAPELRLDRADIILSLQSDFLGNEGDVPLSIRDFALQRRVTGPADRMNRLWVVEGPMTLTGANADERIRVRTSGIAPLAFALMRLLNESHGIPLPAGLDAGALEPFAPKETSAGLGVDFSRIELLSGDLARNMKSSVALAGASLPLEAQAACCLLNSMMGAEGNTLDRESGIRVPGLLSNAGLRELLEEASGGEFAAAIFWGANPSYAFPDASLWKKAVAKIPDTFRIGLYEDETALDCTWKLPENHWLESWGDLQSSAGFVSLRQPTIGALFDTRQGEDVLLSCMRKMGQSAAAGYLEYMRARWKARMYPEGSPVAFEDYWNAALHDGGAQCRPEPVAGMDVEEAAIGNALVLAAEGLVAESSDDMELVLAPGYGVYDGRYANNGWLNELPDPVTKATWENPILLSIADADRIGAKTGDVVRVSRGDISADIPVLVQPGQCDGVASLALGYGRRTGSVAAGIGANAYAFASLSDGQSSAAAPVHISLKSERETRPIPVTQPHDRMEGRNPSRSWTLAEYTANAGEEREPAAHDQASLIPAPEFPGSKWGMAVDLSACVGCSTCVIACQSENNSPVVGPERVLRGRHMHWIRIDRYYEGDARDPDVRHQPMFCQQCDDAPCEIVCPVNATTHSPDGLNQMVYNRCVGTRYCSNNCPFKVRRFNFFDYTSMKTEPENLVFNPEVTVRPRGVMEKCTFCVQRIENAKEKARVENRPIRDGEIQPACVQACPARALVFGNLHDGQSRVVEISKADRRYKVFEELGIRPSVTYLVDISNPADGKDKV